MSCSANNSLRYTITQRLDKILGTDQCSNFYYRPNFYPGFFLDIGWGWIRIIKRLLLPSTALSICACDERYLHSKTCPFRAGGCCKGVKKRCDTCKRKDCRR